MKNGLVIPKSTSFIGSGETTELRQHWGEERAFRTGMTISKAGVVLGLIIMLLNAHNGKWMLFTSDIFLVAGSGLSFWLTTRQKAKRQFIWWPFYFGVLLASWPSAWLSGGLYSPWLAFYLAAQLAFGSVIQTKIRPRTQLLFILANVVGWAVVTRYFQNPGWEEHVHRETIGNLAAYAVIGLSGLATSLFAMLRTERELAAEIERKYAELFETQAHLSREENSNQAKRAFLANISHELRTPLGAILGYAGFLQDEKISSDEKASFAQTIERNGRQLARLVDDLLDLSKIEAGRIEIEKIDFRLTDVVADVLNLLDVHAKKKKLRLSVEFATPVPAQVRTDAFRLKQILMNVIGNALKFTDQGSVRVILRFEEPRTLVIRVLDTGRGISDEERTKLFKPFSQADASMTRRYGGTGLGLNFSRELAKLLGGELELGFSQLDVGSEFTLRIPVETSLETPRVSHFETVEPLLSRAPAPKLELKDARILLVDDSFDNRDLLRRYLAPTGATLVEAADGAECLEKAAQQNFDLVILDLQMPRIDGLQAARILRERKFSGLIVALTAHAMLQDRERCLAAGFNAHIAKPIQRNELLEILSRIWADRAPARTPEINAISGPDLL